MFKNNFQVKKGETILILSDYPTEREYLNLNSEQIKDMIQRIYLAKFIHQVAKELGYESSIILYPATGKSGTEIPENVAEKMLEYDIFLAITTYSLTHTKARARATESGKRGASCPGILPKMFKKNGVMQVDYRLLAKFTQKLADKINTSKFGEIKSSNGTDLKFEIEKNSCKADTGIIINPGDFSNLPAGEAYLPPKYGTTNGTLVVSKNWFKNLKEDMIIKVENGLVQDIEGNGDVIEYFKTLLFSDEYDEKTRLSRRNIAEIGIGTNPNAKDPLNLLEAEKILGTCHVAIGDNHTFGGKIISDIHIDFVIPKAKLYLDGEFIKLNY